MTDPADSTFPDAKEVDPNELADASSSPTAEDEVTDRAEAPAEEAGTLAESEGAEEGDESGQPSTDGGDDAAGATAEGEGEGKKKRRRRRRKKKKPAAEGEAAPEAAAQATEAARKKEPQLPFQKLFDGTARKHAFSVGEVVAGRVTEAKDDVAVLDLFGKAIAYMRRSEPREIPVVAASEEEAQSADAGVSELPAPEQVTTELKVTESQAPGEPVEASSQSVQPESESAEAAEVAPTEDVSAPAEAAASSEAAEATESTSAAEAGDAATEQPGQATEPTEAAEPTPEEVGKAAESAAPAPEQAEQVAATSATEEAPTDTAGSNAEPVEAPTEGQAEAPPSEEPRAEAALAEQENASSAPPPEPEPVPAEPLPEPAYAVTPEGVEPLEAGAIFRGRVAAVAESGHIAIVNELVDVKATRAYLRQAKETRARVPGLVFGYNRGGFDVLVYGIRAFCPVSGMTLEHVEDPSTQLGQWGQFHVQAAKSGAQGIVVSRRSILEKEARKRAKALLKSLQPGQKVSGRVTQVRDFGLFIDIGGVEGLLHQSELSWERGVRPADVAKVGDELEVQVLNVHERESKRERHDRISLSLKALQPDPWKAASADLVEGKPLKGKVVRTAEFGAFVQIAPGVDGLLHITELGRELKHADQAVKVGDELYVVIERVDPKQRRISLSKLSDEEAEAFEKGELSIETVGPRLKVGATVKVRVTQVSPAGLHVQVDNVVGKRGRGFIPNSEMGTPRGTDHRRQWPPGTEVDVVIIGTDRDGGLRCSRKRFLQDEERRAVREYRKEVSKQGLGTFGDILRQKLGLDQGEKAQ